MANGGHGPAAPGAELERLARQYWNAWQDALQRTMPGATTPGMSGFGMPGAFAAPADPWQGVRDWWMQQSGAPRGGLDDLLARVNGQAGAWFEQMQQLAGRLAGQNATPEAVTAAWRDMLGGAGANPFAQMLSGLDGPGLQGWDTWMQRLAPLLGASVDGGRPWHALPTFGLAREHQERWQGFAHALADYQHSQQAFQGLLQQASQDAFAHFERRLRERDPAQPIESPRALFDLWIDAAEDAYADVALSPPFRSAYAEMVAGQMRLRQAVQAEIEQLCRQFDLPTRTELDGAHRKLADLERVVRRLRDRIETLDAGASADRSPAATASTPPRRPAGPTRVGTTPAEVEAGTDSSPAAGASRTVAAHVTGTTRSKTAAKKTGPRKTGARKIARTNAGSDDTPARSAAGAKTAAKRAPAKKAAAKKAAAKKVAAKKAPAGKAPAKKAPARKTAAKKAAAKTPGSANRTVAKPRKTAGRSGTGRRAAAASGAVPTGTAVAAATTARDAVAGTARPQRRVPARASRTGSGSRRGSARGASASPAKRATRAAAPAPSRAGRLPNHGFVSPIPEAPAPMTSGKSGRRKR
ncbi:poly(R)-hydroxyalkanoic acid synthase subunit PhaE [Luteimonas sp BLCC-B24]|uniref:poly(R)-hydroxyalkanoic acid synthase subunit PhaE n=1 Tax=Luteimonas sp. BLCC-B24 TaxID=3025317 RepID=UPI00234DB10E|nr:poly(R)-hydroxyalkanoic acid synthase subunit PhaE [Luteimonas sp. BLCC-B24]MDC7806586.1 poly(R)-hydroxyalkanoic acid synthase subunit PhaE [Luteimonas sp. BLCC-B24]